jgi:ATPase family associated with various cellular activities (AAA)
MTAAALPVAQVRPSPENVHPASPDQVPDPAPNSDPNLHPPVDRTVDALTFALAGLGRVAQACGLLQPPADPESPSNSESKDARVPRAVLDGEAAAQLCRALAAVSSGQEILPQFYEYLKDPQPSDEPLVLVSRQFNLTVIEALAVRIAAAAEEDLAVARVLAQLHSPLPFSRPTVGLLARAYGAGIGAMTSDSSASGPGAAVHLLAQGTAVRFGLLELLDPAVPLPERQLRVPLPTCIALSGLHSPWPATGPLHNRRPIPLARSAEEQAAAFVRRLSAAPNPAPVLIVRSGASAEGRAAAEQVANGCGRRALLISVENTAGLAPWLFLSGFLPVFAQNLDPGERRPVPAIPGYEGPILLLSGPDGEFTSADRTVLEWKPGVPSRQERYELWLASLHQEDLARRLASEHRHTAGRIAALAAAAREHRYAASPDAAPDDSISVEYADIRAASRSGNGAGLSALAELVPDEVSSDALVMPPALRVELESLVSRCLLRDGVSAALGPAMQARYHPAVRALFVGPSGTGKTLAASWLASRLGLPLFRVDIAAITSKYIGETEKNLSQLLTRAEQSEVVLLFDEADALFAKRTEVRDSNDRFANSQTNYLLQRMESYDGITLLTSNNRARFDAAFSRRLDAIVEFPLPGPEERRTLWLAHLGGGHAITPSQLNIVAAGADLSGGQIRNVVLTAAVAAGPAEPISCRHLIAGLASEYRKQARQLSEQLRDLSPPGKP